MPDIVNEPPKRVATPKRLQPSATSSMRHPNPQGPVFDILLVDLREQLPSSIRSGLAILIAIVILILVVENASNVRSGKAPPLAGGNVTASMLLGNAYEVNGIGEARMMEGLALVTLVILRLAMGVMWR